MSGLWGNSLIRRAVKPILHGKSTNTNINQIIDLINYVGAGFYTYEQLINKFGRVIKPLDYYSVLAAIP